MGIRKQLKRTSVIDRKKTSGQAVVPILVPKVVHIPCVQGNLYPARPIVKAGAKVKVGQIVADTHRRDSMPVHSSVSGTVLGIETAVNMEGIQCEHVVIKSDGNQDPARNVQPVQVTNGAEFFEAMRVSGVLDFATIFQSVDKALPYTAIIIDGTESEPVESTDFMTMLTYSGSILAGIHNLIKWLAIPHAYIVISQNKLQAIELFKKHISDIYIEDISVVSVPDGYPGGIRESLEVSCRVEPGKAFICNVSSILKFQQYLSSGMPQVSRAVTLDGDIVKNPQNIEVPIGTLVSHIIDSVAELSAPVKKIIIGGPINGRALPNAEFAISKNCSSIVCLGEDSAHLNEETPCIKCGSCIKVCPMELVPFKLAAAFDKDDVEYLRKNHAEKCVECNACSFACPARRQLGVRIIRAKEVLLNEQQ